MSRYLPKNTKTGDFNTQRTLSESFFVIPERLASIRAVVLAFTANKQTNEQTNKRTLSIIAERRERSERSEANNRVLFEIPRYLYIYIYMSVCTCIAQDRAHLTQVLTSAIVHWNTGCCSEHQFEESPFH